MLASGPKFAGSNPAENILSMPSFGEEVKAACPMSQLFGMLKNPAIAWKSD
jgi:hypothetical protein